MGGGVGKMGTSDAQKVAGRGRRSVCVIAWVGWGGGSNAKKMAGMGLEFMLTEQHRVTLISRPPEPDSNECHTSPLGSVLFTAINNSARVHCFLQSQSKTQGTLCHVVKSITAGMGPKSLIT